jgi:predicted nucleotidyltransferase
MKQKEVLRTLHEHQEEIEAFDVKRIALFGSTARDEAGPDSDVDILVEFTRPIGLFHLFALQNRLEEILGCPVDLGTPDSLKERVRASVMEDLVDVS